MILSDRKIKILEAIINDYIITAEPIASRTIAKKYDLGISSATIRNEMSDLEEMGLILAPHASSGRMPSDKGYRLYVDNMMKHRKLNDSEIIFLQKLIKMNVNQTEILIQETAKILSLLTNCVTVISKMQPSKTKVKYVQIIPLAELAVVLVVITATHVVKNCKLLTNIDFSLDELNEITSVLNKNLQGYCYEKLQVKDNWLLNNIINSFDLNSFCADLQQLELFIISILNNIVSLIKSEDEIKIYKSGIRNILEYKEFSDIDRAKSVFQTLEEKDILVNLLDKY